MPKASSRITLEPAFVLHRYDWSESSVIVELLTRHHGRIALVAKGAKRPASQLRSVLLPMQPLRITYSGDGDVRTLKSTEWVGGYAMPSGQALLAGFYLNELVMRLLPRDDAHASLFDDYAQTVAVLAQNPVLLAPGLRAFELRLLSHMGWLPDLTRQTQTQQPLQENMGYQLSAHKGLHPSSVQSHHDANIAAPFTPEDAAQRGEAKPVRAEPIQEPAVDLHALAWNQSRQKWAYGQKPQTACLALSGQQWLELAQHIQAPSTQALLGYLSHQAGISNVLKTMLRPLLQYHCGQTLKTPQIMSALAQI